MAYGYASKWSKVCDKYKLGSVFDVYSLLNLCKFVNQSSNW